MATHRTNFYRTITIHFTRSEYGGLGDLYKEFPLLTRHQLARALFRLGLRVSAEKPAELEQELVASEQSRRAAVAA